MLPLHNHQKRACFYSGTSCTIHYFFSCNIDTRGCKEIIIFFLFRKSTTPAVLNRAQCNSVKWRRDQQQSGICVTVLYRRETQSALVSVYTTLVVQCIVTPSYRAHTVCCTDALKRVLASVRYHPKRDTYNGYKLYLYSLLCMQFFAFFCFFFCFILWR